MLNISLRTFLEPKKYSLIIKPINNVLCTNIIKFISININNHQADSIIIHLDRNYFIHSLISECPLSPFASGSTLEKIPYVFLPLHGQIIYPSREIKFEGIKLFTLYI